MKKTTTAVVATLAAVALGSAALATMDIQKEYKAKDAEGQLRHLPRREDAEEGRRRAQRLRQDRQGRQGQGRKGRLVEGQGPRSEEVKFPPLAAARRLSRPRIQIRGRFRFVRQRASGAKRAVKWRSMRGASVMR